MCVVLVYDVQYREKKKRERKNEKNTHPPFFWPSCQTPSYVALSFSHLIPPCRLEDVSAGVGAVTLS